MYNDQLDFKKLTSANYNRKSSESEDRQMLSIVSQIEEAQRIATFYRLSKFKYVFQEAKSAKENSFRPEFNKLIEVIRKGEIDSIVCWKLDRLARNMTEGGMIIDLLSSGIIKAIITNDKVYYPTDNVLLMTLEFAQGKQFIKDLSVNVKRGQTKKASMGVPHGVASLGFLNDKTEEKGNRRWLVDVNRFNIIKLLFERFLTGNYSAGQLYRYATRELKLTTVKRKRSGGELITSSRIYEILKDPIYAGFFFYGGNRYELDPNLPRVISEKEHEKIKSILYKRNIPKIQTHVRTYSGFITSKEGDFMGQDIKYQVICDCKYKFSYINKTHCPKCDTKIEKMINPKYLSYTYYYNVKRKKKGEVVKSISEDTVDRSVLDLFDSLDFSNDLIDWSRKYIHELKDKEIGNDLLVAHNIEVCKIEYENKKSRLRILLRDNKITDEEYNQDLNSLEFEYKDILKTSEKGKNWLSRALEITDINECVHEVIKSNNIEAKRNIISKLGSNLVWDEKNLLIINKKEIQALIDAVNALKSKYPEFEPKNYVINKGENEKTPLENEVFSTMLLR